MHKGVITAVAHANKQTTVNKKLFIKNNDYASSTSEVESEK